MFRWMVEEFRVSLFAQELGTAEPVSAVKLDRALADLGAPRPTSEKNVAEKVEKPSPPGSVLPLPEKKPAAVKSLGALDRLFPR
jgi:ATP-dependent helicase HrpA